MATSNFYNKNATNIFAIDEFNFEWEYDDLIDNLLHELGSTENMRKKTLDILWYEDVKWDNDRNYSGKELGYLEMSKWYGYTDNEIEVKVRVKPIVRSGYYGGVNLDYDICIYVNSEGYDIDELIDFGYYFELNRKNFKKWVSNWIDNSLEKLRNETERIFKLNSVPLKIRGRFSNGETIYEKI